MDDLQKIVVLCAKVLLVLAIFGGGYYFATVTTNNDSDTKNPDVVDDGDIKTGPIVEFPDQNVVVTNFEECAAAGNPVMESYPRQCNHSGKNFVEVVDDLPTIPGFSQTICKSTQRDLLCTQQYQPVCGLVNVQCITSPCPPLEQTFSNGCSACSNQLVESYTEGACKN